MPLLTQIPELIAAVGRAQAAGPLAQAQIQAEALRARGANTAQLLGGLGQSLGSIPAQIQQQQAMQQQQQFRALQMQGMQQEMGQRQQELAMRQQAMQGQGRASAAMAEALTQDETGATIYDEAKLARGLAQSGAPVEFQTQALKQAREVNELARSAVSTRNEHLADALNLALAGKNLGALNDWITLSEANGLESPQAIAQARALFPQLQQMGDTPETWQRVRMARDTLAPKKYGQPVMRKEGDVPVDPGTGQPLGPAIPSVPKTRAELAADAANPQSPTAAQSRAALELEQNTGRPPAAKALQRESVLLDGKPTIVQVDPDPDAAVKVFDLEGQPIQNAAARVKPMPPASVTYPNAKPDRLVKVEHKDPTTGKTVIEWLPQSELKGQTFEKGTSATTENRLASAQAVNQTGEDIIAKLSDPAFKRAVGPIMGRFSTLRDFVGNPPPEYAELAGAIESYALANMGVHGMRSAQGAEQIKRLLDQHHTPESLIAAIRGLNKFSEHFMQNEGRPANSAQPSAPASGLPSYQDYLKSRGRGGQ